MLFGPYLFVTLYIVQLLIWWMLILSISFLELLFSYLHNPNFWLHNHFCQLCNVYCQLCSIYCCWHYPVSCVTHTVGCKFIMYKERIMLTQLSLRLSWEISVHVLSILSIQLHYPTFPFPFQYSHMDTLD